MTKSRSLPAGVTSLEQLHQLILKAAGEGIYGLDSEGRATFANDASVKILGWTEEDIVGESLHDIHHHTHKDGSHYHVEDCPIYAALKDGVVRTVNDEVFWHADGHAVPVEYTSTPIWEDGELKGAVVVFRDISERIKIEEERSKAFAEIQDLKEQLEQERDYLRDEINISANFGEIIGESQALKRTLSQIEAVAKAPTSVLVLGESGVGKEMVARAIHMNSDRANCPMVKVNCASIPKELFESEFFGHVRGSFTGAHRDRVGKMQLANNGTLFLDEVGEIPLDLQGKLLRALQESEFERVGDEKTQKVNVRIVAATNRDLMEEVKQGRFREDLYYRLSVFPVEVPPLKERSTDVPLLAQYFIDSICQQLGRKPLVLTKAQASRLSTYEWPGNIRELKNVIERAVILSADRDRLQLEQAMPGTAPQAPIEVERTAELSDILSDDEFRLLEKANLKKAMIKTNWKIAGESGAAKLLGIKPSTLTYRLSQFGIKKPL